MYTTPSISFSSPGSQTYGATSDSIKDLETRVMRSPFFCFPGILTVGSARESLLRIVNHFKPSTSIFWTTPIYTVPSISCSSPGSQVCSTKRLSTKDLGTRVMGYLLPCLPERLGMLLPARLILLRIACHRIPSTSFALVTPTYTVSSITFSSPGSQVCSTTKFSIKLLGMRLTRSPFFCFASKTDTEFSA